MDKRIIVIRDDVRRQRALNVIREIKIDPAKPMEIIIQPFRCTRTLAQNRLMWWWFNHICIHLKLTMGKYYSKEQMRAHFIELFSPVVTEEFMGKITTRKKTTSEMTIEEFTKFLNDIEHYTFDVLHFVLPRREDLYQAAMSKAA